MSKNIEEIRKKVDARFREAASTTFYATIEKVDEKKRTCSVKVGGIIYENVLLYAIEKADLKGFVVIPAVGSKVLVSRIGGGDRLSVKLFSAADKIVYTVDELSVTADKEGVNILAKESNIKVTPGGLTLIRGGSGLKKTLTDLLDAICKLTVTTAVGPSGVPINVADFVKIKQDLENYLEG